MESSIGFSRRSWTSAQRSRGHGRSRTRLSPRLFLPRSLGANGRFKQDVLIRSSNAPTSPPNFPIGAFLVRSSARTAAKPAPQSSCPPHFSSASRSASCSWSKNKQGEGAGSRACKAPPSRSRFFFLAPIEGVTEPHAFVRTGRGSRPAERLGDRLPSTTRPAGLPCPCRSSRRHRTIRAVPPPPAPSANFVHFLGEGGACRGRLR